MRKIKFYLFLIIALNCNIVSAQNLVMNPGFEEYWNFQWAADNLVDTFYAKNWTHIFNGSFSTVDYLAENNIYKNSIVKSLRNSPDNNNAYYPAHSGKAYCGFIYLSADGYMEHLTGKLFKPLTKGENYVISFYLMFPSKYVRLIGKKIEILFSNDTSKFILKKDIALRTFYKYLFSQEKVKADLEFDISNVQDTAWTKYSCNYIAKGGEQFISFGIFWQGRKISKKIINFNNNIYNLKTHKKLYNKITENFNKKIPFFKKNIYYQNVDFDNIIIESTKLEVNNHTYIFIDDVSVELVNDTIKKPEDVYNK